MVRRMATTVDLERAAEEIRASAVQAGIPVREYVMQRFQSADGPLPNAEWAALLLALPRLDDSRPSSAEIIRELRGPLPEDDGNRR